MRKKTHKQSRWRRRRRWINALAMAAGAVFCPSLVAQYPNTVRQNEFRSRWADYQVDRPAEPIFGGAPAPDEPAGLLGTFSRRLSDLFRKGPFQLRANFATGWEYSDETYLSGNDAVKTSDHSPFAAPSLGFFYNREFGPATFSLRYSAGYVYYVDQSYVAADRNGGGLSQTAALDLKVEGKRTALSSTATLSQGSGNDIETGTQRERISLGETVVGTYLLTPFSQLGTTAAVNYTTYSAGTRGNTNGVADTTSLNDTGSVYFEYAYSPKTRGRVELAAGQEYQTVDGATGAGGADSGNRWYYQALFSADYLPSAKLSMSAGFGYGVQNNSTVLGQGRSGSHPIYRLTLQYVPTEKTSATCRFGYEGVDVEPSLDLQVAWQFRLTTSARLSVYQTSNFSTYQIAQNLTTDGVLAALQQRFFGRVDVALSAGVERSAGYGALTARQPSANEDPYYFGAISLLWQMNSSLALQAYYRGSTGRNGVIANREGLQSRAAVSFRLTF